MSEATPMEEDSEKASTSTAPVLEPEMSLAQTAFRYGRLVTGEEAPEGVEAWEETAEGLKARLEKAISEKQMAPFYEHACSKFGWEPDEGKLKAMKESNEAERAYLAAKLADAEVNAGDMEVVDALFEAARFEARIGGKESAYKANDAVLARPKVSGGRKVDAVMNKVRVALFYLDTPTAREQLTEAKKLAETGGDWDRNNRLAVYEAIHQLVHREIKDAAPTLLAGVATFTCTEMCDYPDFVFYAVLANLLHLSRPELKKKVLDGPDVLQIMPQIPHLKPFVQALYDCDYAAFFRHLLPIDARIRHDRYLAPHAKYLRRELRVLVYTQFLDAYKSVTLQAMADKFNVSLDFLDRELAHFVAQHRLNANIDKVDMVVHTNRPDPNSAHYQTIIKQGDLLLNQIQKLARCVSI